MKGPVFGYFPAGHIKGMYSLIFLYVICLMTINCHAQSEGDYTTARKKMVAEQIAARGIRDPQVLRAMEKVERHLFVPENIRYLAYSDTALPIGEGQTISQPYIVALMTEAVKPHAAMKVLEIGTGSGYPATDLAEICGQVYTIEIIPSLAKRAEAMLKKTYKNVQVRSGDGYQGWPEAAPFDAIMVTCAPTKVPLPLVAQLKEGGRMVIPVGERWAQKLYVFTKRQDKLIEEEVVDVLFVPMVDPQGRVY
ncbi:MAG: protein-L-isoaspartate(D-aspartate) O-methyltransferase [Syntrophales bacterium]|nr:protein-L-isoaspartate(D-aspartate) O-methyltransferase [Syntrophales bacterium]